MTPRPVHAALLVSPSGGDGIAGRVAGTVAELIRDSVYSLRTLTADSAEGSARLAADAVSAGADLLVVLGGDGLAHLGVQACAGTSTSFGVIPAGTGNDLARWLGMPADPVVAAAELAKSLTAGRRRPVDLGKIAGGSWFSTVLCAGFDAAVNARANAMRWPRGPHRYDLAVLAELAAFRARPVWVGTDEGTLSLDATMIAIGNTPTYGGGIPICPDASPEDGQLDVTVVGGIRRTELLRMLPTLRSGRHVRHPAVQTLRARSIRLSGSSGWRAYADGEPQARLPITVNCVPRALSIVPPAATAPTV